MKTPTRSCNECGRHRISCFGLHDKLREYETNCFRPIGSILIWDELEFYIGELGKEVDEYIRRVGA